MKAFLLLVSMTLAAATSAPAQDKPAAPPPAEAAKPKPPRKVCRTFQVTGRRIADTVCQSSEAWAEVDSANEHSAAAFINGVSGRSGTPADAKSPFDPPR